MKVEDFLRSKNWTQQFMADRVNSTLGNKGVSQGVVSNWVAKGFVVTSEGWIINPKQNCRLIEKHWPCNEFVMHDAKPQSTEQQPADYELVRLRKRVKELEAALNDQLNDCINFDGGKLTDAIMAKSAAILRGGV